ncbi:LuxR C-terminal-related transcriptional regulator, partial [Chloroflexota bacterium]
ISPNTEVIILTAYEYDQYVFPLLEAGASGYFLKDVSSQELIKAVRRINSGEKVFHPVIARKAVNYFTHASGKGQTLTNREMEVLQLVAKGQSNKQIAHTLKLSIRTVQAHLGNIFNKLEVYSRSEAVNVGLKSGILILEDIVNS